MSQLHLFWEKSLKINLHYHFTKDFFKNSRANATYQTQVWTTYLKIPPKRHVPARSAGEEGKTTTRKQYINISHLNKATSLFYLNFLFQLPIITRTCTSDMMKWQHTSCFLLLLLAKMRTQPQVHWHFNSFDINI